MIIVFIICAILYLIMIYAVLSLYYKYRKDIEEIENRCLQLEKRNSSKVYKDSSKEDLQELRERWENEYCNWVTGFPIPNVEFTKLPNGKIVIKDKEVDNMACKKGRGGRKK